jgi:hypothetical protein
MAGFFSKKNSSLNPIFGNFTTEIPKRLKSLSNLGLEYNSSILKQSFAVGETEYENFLNHNLNNTSDQEFRLSLALQDSSAGGSKSIAYFDKTYPGRRDYLRKFAQNSEIDWCCDVISDECVCYDDQGYFCQPTLNIDPEQFNPDVEEEIKTAFRTNFKKIYTYFHFYESGFAWNLFKQFLIDGYLAFEIIYSKDQKNIIGIKQLDPITLFPAVEEDEFGNLKLVWFQELNCGFGGSPNALSSLNDSQNRVNQRKLYDSQIIYISYVRNVNITDRISYCEKLIRSHNLLRLMEQTRIIWNVMHSNYRLKITVPIGNSSKQRAQENLNEMLARYKESIYLNDSSGELTVNGKSNIEFWKSYILPQKNGEGVEIETLDSEGPPLQDTDVLEYFRKVLICDSKIPFNRWQRDGTASTYMSFEGIEREEGQFARFCSRLRAIFQEILIKPIRLQMYLDFPDLTENELFGKGIGLQFNKDSYYEELKHIELVQKRVEYVSSLKDITDSNDDKSMFSSEWLIRQLGLTEDEILENQKFKDKEKEQESGEEDNDEY